MGKRDKQVVLGMAFALACCSSAGGAAACYTGDAKYFLVAFFACAAFGFFIAACAFFVAANDA